jgi:hypothetical protein
MNTEWALLLCHLELSLFSRAFSICNVDALIKLCGLASYNLRFEALMAVSTGLLFGIWRHASRVSMPTVRTAILTDSEISFLKVEPKRR